MAPEMSVPSPRRPLVSVVESRGTTGARSRQHHPGIRFTKGNRDRQPAAHKDPLLHTCNPSSPPFSDEVTSTIFEWMQRKLHDVELVKEKRHGLRERDELVFLWLLPIAVMSHFL